MAKPCCAANGPTQMEEAPAEVAGEGLPAPAGSKWVYSSRGQDSDRRVLAAAAQNEQRALAIQRLAAPPPRSYFYDRLARCVFWGAVLAAAAMLLHLALLALLMWRRADVPDVLWFPRLEIMLCLAVLPALTFGASGGSAARGTPHSGPGSTIQRPQRQRPPLSLCLSLSRLCGLGSC